MGAELSVDGRGRACLQRSMRSLKSTMRVSSFYAFDGVTPHTNIS
jgi:hypothetical protein